MHPHKGRPAAIRPIEMGQMPSAGIGAAGADQDGLDPGPVAQVGLEGRAHRRLIPRQIKVIRLAGLAHKGVDLVEGVPRHDVDGLQGVG